MAFFTAAGYHMPSGRTIDHAQVDATLRSRSIQPYGAATTRPASAHYADQAPLFVAKQFKPVWFTRAEVAKHAKSREVIRN